MRTTWIYSNKMVVLACVVGSLVALSPWILAEVPEPPATSQFAPAADLVAQIDAYLEDIEEAVGVPDDEYSELKQKKVRRSAATLAALALVLGKHDQDHRVKSSAADLLAAAKRLAEGSADVQAARRELAAVKKAAAGQAGNGGAGALEWQVVASQEDLMKPAQLINSRLKRYVRGTKLKSAAAETTAGSAALAAIAQVSMVDTSHVEKETDLAKWYQYCADMRDAAGQLNQAIHNQDEAAVTTALDKLNTSCDDCHKVFAEDAL